MVNQTENSHKGFYSPNWRLIGGAIVFLAAILAGITHQWLFYLLAIPGLILSLWGAHKQGKLKQYAWMLAIYTLLFAVLIYLQLNSD